MSVNKRTNMCDGLVTFRRINRTNKSPIITEQRIKKILGDAYRHNMNNMHAIGCCDKKSNEDLEKLNDFLKQRLDEIGLLFSLIFGISYNNAIFELDAYREEENERDYV